MQARCKKNINIDFQCHSVAGVSLALCKNSETSLSLAPLAVYLEVLAKQKGVSHSHAVMISSAD